MCSAYLDAGEIPIQRLRRWISKSELTMSAAAPPQNDALLTHMWRYACCMSDSEKLCGRLRKLLTPVALIALINECIADNGARRGGLTRRL